MLRLVLLALLPVVAYSAVQCYVGQKLFSYESNNAVCARFIPYACTAQCEWRKNCDQHSSYNAFRGRRTFVSGLLINAKSTMVLCCASLSTRIESDATGAEKCSWREEESISVLGPSIRTSPVLAPNHYIRNVRIERDGTARVDVALEVCQYQTEIPHCNVQNMTETEKKRFNIIQLKLQRAEAAAQAAKGQTGGNNVAPSAEVKKDTNICAVPVTTGCGRDILSQINACCKDKANCETGCLKSVESILQTELVHQPKGCSSGEVTEMLECLGNLVNTAKS